ncbi:MAG TPA: NADH-quinone oxidoreductase subunit C [Methanocella sp.]|uniref:NADH-quinone oxidoreductase subunit C n=1 Tax=Methanocella sp. TaxID=2052833 RepID=UPI002B508B30|nr:NADH-quinone oxidoreductase subunit C [Methanocella sp.]HTY89562.1 NADH-quinone oxidoreductase subunit C [Methanocella sp.]
MEAKTVTQAELQGIVNGLKARDARLITIVGVDTGENIEVIYFFHTGIGRTENYRVVVPKAGGNEEIESITPIIPAAYIAENELCEMFGVRVKNVPGRFFLHPSINAPLRRK